MMAKAKKNIFYTKQYWQILADGELSQFHTWILLPSKVLTNLLEISQSLLYFSFALFSFDYPPFSFYPLPLNSFVFSEVLGLR